MLNPGISFVALPRSSVCVFRAFEKLTQPLQQLFGGIEISASDGKEKIIVPCLLQQLPAVTKFFPDADVLKSIPNCGQAQAAIRTITVPGFQFDIKFSLACLLTSAIRALPCWAAAVAPDVTDILKKVFPGGSMGIWRSCRRDREQREDRRGPSFDLYSPGESRV
jgi:hypothetical protein